jgi:hypothetical protein
VLQQDVSEQDQRVFRQLWIDGRSATYAIAVHHECECIIRAAYIAQYACLANFTSGGRTPLIVVLAFFMYTRAQFLSRIYAESLIL